MADGVRSRAERARVAARRLVVRESPEPRIAHTVVLLLVLSDLGLRTVGEPTAEQVLREPLWPLLGLLLVLVAQVLAALSIWSRLPDSWLLAVPLLDLGAVGLMRLNPDGAGVGVLAVLPVIWLVWQWGGRGAVIASAACTVFFACFGFAYFGMTSGALSRSVLFPLVLSLLAVVSWALLANAREQQEEAARRSADLTAALEELASLQGFSEAVFDSVDVGLVLLGPDGEYLTVNGRHEDFMDLAFPAGHAGRAGQLGEVYAEDATRPLARHEMPSLRAAQGEEFDDIRMWVGADPQSRRALSVSARSVRDPRGRFAGAALAYKDVTDFMRAMAVKDDFVAMVSHEFRTPLTSISGYVSMLLDEADGLPPEAARYLQVVARNADRLGNLVTDLLETSRLDASPMEIAPVPTDVCDLVRTAAEAARPAAQGKGLDLLVDLPRSLDALIDPQRFSQVVDNLVSNAIKYTPAGGRVAVGMLGHEDHLEFTVADTGPGISADDRERLFTRFFRTPSAESSSVPGVGLGLSITKKIVEAHGGRVEVDSAGSGSTFTVWLPLGPVRREGSPRAAAIDPARVAPVTDTRVGHGAVASGG